MARSKTKTPACVKSALDEKADIFIHKTEYEPGYRSKKHHFPLAQLIYPSQGVMTLSTGDGVWIVPQFRAVWLPSDEPHAVETKTGLRMHSVYFRGAVLRQLPKRCCIVAVNALLRETIIWHERFADSIEYASIARSAKRIITGLTAAGAKHASVANHEFFAPYLADSALQVLQNSFLKNPSDDRSLEDWARELGVSSRTLARRLQREAGVSFTQLREQARLLSSIEMLLSGRSVTQAAYDAGFSSPSMFIKLFRRAFGETPKKFLMRDHASLD